MRALLHSAALGAACSATLVCSVPGFAQTHTVRHRDAPNTMAIEPALTSHGVVQVYDAQNAAGSATIPPNVTVSPHLLPMIESMLRGSPTFRRQCQRIASATHLTVVVGGASHPQPGPRARTRVSADAAGRLHARVEVISAHDHAELIAHELEHIIEQLDGIDLATRATRPAAGVHRCPDGAFETVRAVRAGRTVAQEMGHRAR